MRIIGAVGANGSGKDEVLKYLREQHGIPFLATGDMVRAIAAEEGLEPTREVLGSLSERTFAAQGPGCFVRMASERIAKEGWAVAGISGIRSADDVHLLRDLHGHDFVLIHVDVAEPQVRFERMTHRASARDPLDFAEFLALDEREELIFRLSEAIDQADATLANDGSLEELHRGIDRLVREQRLLG